MNLAHDVICSSGRWARAVETDLLPWGLAGVDLGPKVLELGPGFGASTRVLSRRPGSFTVLEPQARYCRRLMRELDGGVAVVHGDATRMPFDAESFSAVVCFTMLHHVPSRALQDRLFEEAARVLRGGGVFAGTDSLGRSLLFRAIHVGDDLEAVDPSSLAGRLESAGLIGPQVDVGSRSLRFRAHKPV